MLHFIENQILFYIAIVLVMFLPGYCLLLAVFRKSKIISMLEKFIISFGLGIVVVDFIIFLYSKLNISITRLSSVAGIFIFSAICLGIYKLRRHPEDGLRPDEGSRDSSFRSGGTQNEGLFSFSKNQFILILLLLFLTVFIKTIFLAGSITPTATDMGHHMYYSKWITENGRLTDYEDSIINPEDKGKFIIGEHIVFSVIYLLSNQSFFSGWPVVVLYLINLLSILTVFVLTLRIFENKNIAILSLLFLGALFAVSAPQARYVSGGVLGNVMGNFLMPLTFYFYYMTFSVILSSDPSLNKGSKKNDNEILRFAQDDKNSSRFLSFAIFVTFGLFYTHHLTGFIFLFVWMLIIPLFVILNYKDIETVGKKVLKIILSPQVIATFIVGLVFFFLIFTPSYIKSSAVGTAVGTPTKVTRTGLNIGNLRQTVGDARLALGFLGLIILAFNFRKRNFGYILTASWAIMVFVMAVYPKLLFVNIPSNRIGNYLTYPLAILSAYGFYVVFRKDIFNIIPQNLIRFAFLITLALVLISGVSDSAQAFKKNSNAQEAVQTFNASEYLVKNSDNKDVVLKDHNYLTADSWIKLYFMRDYKYPASRTTLSRYEDTTKPREMCTYHMISAPASDEALKCFSDTKTDFIMVNPLYDSAQFKKLSDFDQVYMNDEVVVYYREN